MVSYIKFDFKKCFIKISGEKRYKCHVCSSLFSTKGSLKVHMRLHTGAKPFKCPHCHIRFRTSGHRKSHILSHFKSDAPKKKRSGSRHQEPIQSVNLLNTNDVNALVNQQTIGQVISIDQSMLGSQSMLPVSLSIPEQYGSLSESTLAANVLQGLDGIQLHFSGLNQGIQISGIDPNLMSQTVQIDASLLQQLQQQGNINITLNPNIVGQPAMPEPATTDPNLIQIHQMTIPETNAMSVNPNIIIQSMNGVQGLEGQQVLPQHVLQNSMEESFVVSADPSDTQVSIPEEEVV